MKFDKQLFWIRTFALIGLITSIKLALIYYNANFDKYTLSSFCSINSFIDCDGVAKTSFSQAFGIPLAYWGIFFYLITLFLTFVDKLKNCKFLKFLKVFKEPKAYITFLGTTAFFISMILAIISVVIIKKVCILCVATYFIDLIIAIIASNGSFHNLLTAFKTTFIDFIDGVKNYTLTFIIILLLFTSFLAYSGITLNFVPHIKRYNSLLKYSKMKTNPYKINGNTLGNENGTVIIKLYSDFVCPLCYIQNIMLHQATKEFKNIKIIHYNYPFDKACNPNVNYSMHPKACFMSKAAIASQKQGNYWGMSSLLYEKQPKNEEELSKLTEQLNLDHEQLLKDLYSEETLKKLNSEITDGGSYKIDATPTMVINSDIIVGVQPYYELKKLLMKYGAK